jgi:hypothetical protein
MCPVPLKPAVLQWYGYTAAGGGFHCLEMDETVLATSVAEQENAATVIIIDVDPRSKLSVQLLFDDLKKLVDANWDWQVKRTSDSDFSVVFPNSASLNLCKNTGGLTLPISKVSVLFVEPRSDPGASVSLAKVWLLLSGVPEVLRRADLLLEATKMLGRPRMVDDASLVGHGPVRMLFHSPNPNGLPNSIMLFANLQGYRIGVKAELAKDKETAPSQSARDLAEDDEETDDMSRSETHWKRLPPKGKDGDNTGNVAQGEASQKHEPLANQNRQQQAQDAIPQDQPQTTSIYTYKKGYYKVSAGKLRQKQSVGSSSVPLPSVVDSSVTKPASSPAKSKVQPIPFNQYGTNIPQSEAFAEDADRAHPNTDCNVEAGERGTPIVLSEDDSPPPQPDVDKIQKLTPAERTELGWESPPGWDYDNETIAARITKLKKKRDGEVDNPAVSPAQTMASPAARDVPSEASTPASGSRRSHRIMGSDAEPVLQKAIRATALKNAPGMTPSEAFVSFPAFSDAHFLGVASDSSLVFDSSFGSPKQVISLVHAKEVA